MGMATGLITIGATAAAWSAIWNSYYRTRTGADELHWAESPDGWKLALSRYLPEGERARKHPVLLCHGLGANRFTFDLDEETSLARFLASEGYDVWVLELRGSGLSDRPGFFSKKHFNWSFDDYLRLDLPSAIDRVLEKTGASALHFGGHSMGGMLLYSWLATADHTKIRSGISIGASLESSHYKSEFHSLRKLEFLAGFTRAVPIGIGLLMSSPLYGHFRGRFEKFFVHPENADPKRLRRLLAIGFHAVSSDLLLQLGTAFDEGGLRTFDKSSTYADRLSVSEVPVLAVSGNRDTQCQPESSSATLKRLGGGRNEILEMEDFGHFDLLMGENAREKIFPKYSEWLGRFDS